MAMAEGCRTERDDDEAEEGDVGKPYSEGLKRRILQRMTGPNPTSASALSREFGIAQSTLSRWRSLVGMDANNNKPTSPRERSAEDRIRVVFEAAKLSEDELGAFLRREGLHHAQLEEWREAVMQAASRELERPRTVGADKAQTRRIRELEKELLRKDKALAEVTALLALQKKLEGLWGDEGDATTRRSGRGS